VVLVASAIWLAIAAWLMIVWKGWVYP